MVGITNVIKLEEMMKNFAAAMLMAVISLSSACAREDVAKEATAEPVAEEIAFDADAVVIAANPEDVASIDAIMAAVYDVISGPAGEPRDWDRMRSLFIPGARLIPNQGGKVRVMSVEEYVESGSAFFKENGFFELEISRKTDRYGDIVQIFSTYEAHKNADDAEPFLRGINSFQLLYQDDRWWIVTIFWQAESEDNPIPNEYLD